MSLQALIVWLGLSLGVVLFGISARSSTPAYVQSEVRRHAPLPTPVVRPLPQTVAPQPRVVEPMPQRLEQRLRHAGGGCIRCGMG